MRPAFDQASALAINLYLADWRASEGKPAHEW
jgi:hypothetical protein